MNLVIKSIEMAIALGMYIFAFAFVYAHIESKLNKPKTMFQKVKEFHTTFNCHIEETPTIPPYNVVLLRMALIKEEYTELMEAMNKGDIVAIDDAICDLHYVVSGTAVSYGIPEDESFDEVHRSNMSKANEDGTVTYREDGKVLKSKRFTPPDLKSIIEKHSYGVQ